MDLLEYWNLQERPFEPTWDTRFFFQSRDHDEALSRLSFLVGEQTMLFGMMTGEIGCGKTLTRAVFTQRLDPRRFAVVTLENASFSFADMLQQVLQDLDGNPPDASQTKFGRVERLKKAAERVHAERRHLVMIFDEAQEMTDGALNELKLLTNLNQPGKHYLTIILVGQPELRTMVTRLPAINQRISLRFHLNSLDLEDSVNYVRHRLTVAGHPAGDLFPREAVERAYQISLGVPRELNRIAKLSLEYAWVKEFPNVNLNAVEAVVRDLQRHQNLPKA